MVPFNTTNLKAAVQLSGFKEADISNSTVSKVTYGGDTFPEGVVPLIVGKEQAVDVSSLVKLEKFFNSIWSFQRNCIVQIGLKNNKPVIFVYATND